MNKIKISVLGGDGGDSASLGGGKLQLELVDLVHTAVRSARGTAVDRSNDPPRERVQADAMVMGVVDGRSDWR